MKKIPEVLEAKLNEISTEYGESMAKAVMDNFKDGIDEEYLTKVLALAFRAGIDFVVGSAERGRQKRVPGAPGDN